jgi:hypothetical protein
MKIPSSGSMVRVKFRRSSGFGKAIFMVFGRESSVMSGEVRKVQEQKQGDRDLFGREFGLR